MIGQVQSSETIGHYGQLRSYGYVNDQQEGFRLARTGKYNVEVFSSSADNYIGPSGSIGEFHEKKLFMLFDTSFLMGKYPASAEIEIEFTNNVGSYTNGPIETQVRLANWVPPLTGNAWLAPAEFSSSPMLASVVREYLGENHASGSRVTIPINSQAAFTNFNPTGFTGIVIAYGVFARDEYQTTWPNRIAWTGAARPRLRVLSTQEIAADQPAWGRPDRANSIYGILDNPLATLGTEMNSSALGRLGEVSSGFLRVTLDPGRVMGEPEIVHIIGHSAGSNIATIRRAVEATDPRSHPAGIAWEHAPTIADYRLATLSDVRPDIYLDSAKRTLVENPQWQPLVTSSPRYVSGPGTVYTDAPPQDPSPGTIFISRSGAFFDMTGKQL